MLTSPSILFLPQKDDGIIFYLTDRWCNLCLHSFSHSVYSVLIMYNGAWNSVSGWPQAIWCVLLSVQSDSCCLQVSEFHCAKMRCLEKVLFQGWTRFPLWCLAWRQNVSQHKDTNVWRDCVYLSNPCRDHGLWSILAVWVGTELTSLTQFWPYSACFWPPHGSCLSRTPCSWQWADHQASGARPARHKKTDQLLAIPKGLKNSAWFMAEQV